MMLGMRVFVQCAIADAEVASFKMVPGTNPSSFRTRHSEHVRNTQQSIGGRSPLAGRSCSTGLGIFTQSGKCVYRDANLGYSETFGGFHGLRGGEKGRAVRA